MNLLRIHIAPHLLGTERVALRSQMCAIPDSRGPSPVKLQSEVYQSFAVGRDSEIQYHCGKPAEISVWPRGRKSICQCLTGRLVSPQGTKVGQQPKAPCRPGFSQSFYTVIVSRDVLRGQSILKGKHAAGSHLLTEGFSSSLLRCIPNRIVWWSEWVWGDIHYGVWLSITLKEGQNTFRLWPCKNKKLVRKAGTHISKQANAVVMWHGLKKCNPSKLHDGTTIHGLSFPSEFQSRSNVYYLRLITLKTLCFFLLWSIKQLAHKSRLI